MLRVKDIHEASEEKSSMIPLRHDVLASRIACWSSEEDSELVRKLRVHDLRGDRFWQPVMQPCTSIDFKP